MPEQAVNVRAFVVYSDQYIAEQGELERIRGDPFPCDEDFGCPR
jgi:hypothetical protein